MRAAAEVATGDTGVAEGESYEVRGACAADLQPTSGLLL
jgi:hypothetical protein